MEPLIVESTGSQTILPFPIGNESNTACKNVDSDAAKAENASLSRQLSQQATTWQTI